jgi:Flp pilus assembly protein TadG
MSGNRGTARHREGGQILVIFALAALAIIGMVGLVLDGGSTFAQRRNEQNAADLAALAGANAYLNSSGNSSARTTAAQNAAIAAATRNGYTNTVNGATVPTPTVELLQSGARVTVSITAPHPNTFARVMGQNSWDVSVTAAAISGSVDTAVGAAPWTMSVAAFNSDGSPKYTSANPQDFGDGNGDVPNGALDIAWTDFNGANNVNTAEVRAIINGSNVITATFVFDQYLGQHNNGNHTALFGDVQQYLAGKNVPVPIVGPGSPNCSSPTSYQDGCFKGWAMFHVVSAQGGSSKTITGYFLSDFVQSPLSVGECPHPPDPNPNCGLPGTTGSFNNWLVRLTN